MIDRLSKEPRDALALFDSAVPEPKSLLQELIARAFTEPATPRYTSAFIGGNPYTVAALAKRYDVARERIICTTGATEGLHTVYRALLDPGDHVLVETPRFELFDSLANANQLTVTHFTRRAPRFELDLDALQAALTPQTRMVVISDLHNPSSYPVPGHQLDALAKLAETHDFWVVVDEVYRDYGPRHDRQSIGAKRSERFITISSLTKIYGLSTLRCGWIIASGEALRTLRHYNDHFSFGVSKLGHAMAALVLENSDRFDAYVQTLSAAARPVMQRHIQQWRDAGWVEGELPEHGCVAFLKLNDIEDTHAFSDWLMDHNNVIVAPGELFGLAGHVRLGYVQDPGQLEDALSRFGEGLALYRQTRLRKVV
ncbi:pyridoxal phosphate-dependent aminotransferase [Oceanicaulis sp. LC35]|uniref:pyridoxal phosphate-dependent aminotransferase n=1 Tax=Oceanicaulis sp. LC35 TaxID=3349635 RepID=UPI003F859E62